MVTEKEKNKQAKEVVKNGIIALHDLSNRGEETVRIVNMEILFEALFHLLNKGIEEEE